MKAIVLIGPSCCGKKKVGEILSEYLKVPPAHYLEMGELLRTLIHSQKDAGFTSFFQRAFGCLPSEEILQWLQKDEMLQQNFSRLESLCREFWSKNFSEKISVMEWVEFCVRTGSLVPNAITYGCIQLGLERTLQSAGHSSFCLIDGYPRSVEAASDLLQKLQKLQISLAKCFHLWISPQEMTKRAQRRGRSDDTEPALQKRYQFYLESVVPTIEWLKFQLGSDKVQLVDASNPDLSAKNSITKTARICLEALRNTSRISHETSS